MQNKKPFELLLHVGRLMHQLITSANIAPGNPRGFAKDPNPAGRDLYQPKFSSRGRTFAQKNVPYLNCITSLFDDFLSRFVSVVDSMYRNRVRKIVVSTQIVRDFCCLMKKDRHMNLSKLSKTLAVYLRSTGSI